MQIITTFITALKSIAALAVALLIGLGSQVATISMPKPPQPAPLATPASEQASSTAALPAPSAATTTKRVATATATKTPAVAPAAPTASTPAPIVALDAAVLNEQTRGALANILCTTLAGGALAPISGSGVFIDNRGVILTNAHVAQFFLLRDYGVKNNIDCVVRIGSPAAAAYRAELLYLPPEWVAENASQLKAQTATGTGENDYAFVRVTGTTNPDGTLPSIFPRIAMSTRAPEIGESMLLAAYPAGFLSGQFISSQLYASSAFAYVTQLFTYSNPHEVDLFSIGGSIESQAGSSGGAVVRQDGTLAGIISTATLASSTNARDLRAITVTHINNSLAAAGKGGILDLLSGDIAAKAADFNATVAPGETATLEAALEQK